MVARKVRSLDQDLTDRLSRSEDLLFMMTLRGQ